MKKRKKSKNLDILKNIERALLLFLFIIIPFFKGCTDNNGIMLLHLLTFILAISTVLYNILQKNTFAQLSFFDFILLMVVILGFVHLIFSGNTFESYILLNNFLFAILFYFLYIKHKDLAKMKELLAISLVGLVIQIFAGYLQIIISPLEPAKGGFRDPNYFGLYLVTGALVILGYILFTKQKPWIRNSLIAVVIATFPLIIATKSRSATGVFLLLLLSMFFIKKPKYSLIGLGLIVLTILLPNPYKSHIEEVHKSDPYAYTRVNIYQMDLEMFADYFITGVGLGCFGTYSPEYNFPVKTVPGHYRVTPIQAHNSFLHWTIETGAFGLILMLLILAIILRNSYKNILYALNKKNFKVYNPGPDFALLAIIIISMIHNALYNNAILYLFIIFATFSAKSKEVINKRKSLIEYFKFNKQLLPIILIFTLTISLSLAYFMIFISWESGRQLEQAYEKILEEKTSEAIPNIEICLKYLPFHNNARLLKANLQRFRFVQSQNLEIGFNSLTEYEEGLNYFPRSYDLKMGKIHLLIFMQDFIKRHNPMYTSPDFDIKIKSEFVEITKIHPKDVFILHDFAVYLKRQNNTDWASEVLKKAIMIEPNYINGHRLLSSLYLEIGKQEESKLHADKVKEIQTKYNIDDYKNDNYLLRLLK